MRSVLLATLRIPTLLSSALHCFRGEATRNSLVVQSYFLFCPCDFRPSSQVPSSLTVSFGICDFIVFIKLGPSAAAFSRHVSLPKPLTSVTPKSDYSLFSHRPPGVWSPVQPFRTQVLTCLEARLASVSFQTPSISALGCTCRALFLSCVCSVPSFLSCVPDGCLRVLLGRQSSEHLHMEGFFGPWLTCSCLT